MKIGVIHKSVSGSPRKRRQSRRSLWSRLKSTDLAFSLDFNIPDNLFLLACHNLEGDSLFELQMAHLSVPSDKYKVIRYSKEKTTPWSHFLRWKGMVKYLESDALKGKEYIICLDPTDVLFIDSPSNILDNFLNHFDCDLLYNSTAYGEQYRWDKYTQEARDHHNFKRRQWRWQRNLNGGLCIGKRDFIIDIYKRVLSYELDSNGERDESGWWENPDYPYGCAHDQQVLRFLEHEYYPRMQIDGGQKLFIRR